MNRFIAKLKERKSLTAVLAGGYFAAVVLCHKEVSRVFDWLSKELSFEVYNNIAFGTSLFLAAAFFAFVLFNIRKGDRRRLKISYWLFTALLVGASYKTLIVFNVESIHFVQYAVLALLVFPLAMRYGETVLWCTLLGALDEGYQYFVLYRDYNDVYFDFNDILLNLVGAGIGALILFTFVDRKPESLTSSAHSSRNRTLSPALVITVFLLSAGVFSYAAGLLQLYPEAGASGIPVTLSRKPAPEKFWTVPKQGKPFHILTPLEGIISAAVLTGCYASMDRWFTKR